MKIDYVKLDAAVLKTLQKELVISIFEMCTWISLVLAYSHLLTFFAGPKVLLIFEWS